MRIAQIAPLMESVLNIKSHAAANDLNVFGCVGDLDAGTRGSLLVLERAGDRFVGRIKKPGKSMSEYRTSE